MSPELMTIRAAIEVAERLERERDAAQAEAERMGRENDRLCDELNDLRDRLAKLDAEYATLLAAQEGRAA